MHEKEFKLPVTDPKLLNPQFNRHYIYRVMVVEDLGNMMLNNNFEDNRTSAANAVCAPGTHQISPQRDATRPTPTVKTSHKGKQGSHQMRDAVAMLEQMDVLNDRRLCLSLLALLSEHVGYEYAGDAETITVAELMLISARLSKLAEQFDQLDLS